MEKGFKIGFFAVLSVVLVACNGDDKTMIGPEQAPDQGTYLPGMTGGQPGDNSMQGSQGGNNMTPYMNPEQPSMPSQPTQPSTPSSTPMETTPNSSSRY